MVVSSECICKENSQNSDSNERTPANDITNRLLHQESQPNKPNLTPICNEKDRDMISKIKEEDKSSTQPHADAQGIAQAD